MYPEEKLGGLINSPSSQWDNVEKLFDGFRDIISSGTGFTSGSFCVQWTQSCQQFWEVVGTFNCYFLCDVDRSNVPLLYMYQGTHETRLQADYKNRCSEETIERRTNLADNNPLYH